MIKYQKANILSHTKTAQKTPRSPIFTKRALDCIEKSQDSVNIFGFSDESYINTRATHTHTHTHTQTYTLYILTLLWQVVKDDNGESAHKHAHTLSYTHTHAHTQTHIQYIRTHTYTHTHPLTHTYNIQFHAAITGAEERECVAVCCSVLQCVAVCCSVLQCDCRVHILSLQWQVLKDDKGERVLILRFALETWPLADMPPTFVAEIVSQQNIPSY